MKFRIKEITYNDVAEFYPQWKTWWSLGWRYMRNCGGGRLKCFSLEKAKEIIDADIKSNDDKKFTKTYHYHGRDF